MKFWYMPIDIHKNPTGFRLKASVHYEQDWRLPLAAYIQTFFNTCNYYAILINYQWSTTMIFQNFSQTFIQKTLNLQA